MIKDFIFLDKNLSPLISVSEIFKPIGGWNIESGAVDRVENLISNSFKSGSTSLGMARNGTQSLTFKNPVGMNMIEHNDLIGLLENVENIAYEGVSEDYRGYQKCSINEARMAWDVGNFGIGGTLTITVTLLNPFFENYEQYAIRPPFQANASAEQFASFDVPFRDSSFFIRLQAQEPNQGFRIAIEGSQRAMSYSDIQGFGVIYFVLQVDSRDNSVTALYPDGGRYDAGNLVTDGAPFLIPRGLGRLQILSQGDVFVDNFYIRRRWGV